MRIAAAEAAPGRDGLIHSREESDGSEHHSEAR
jgi:hypothetical protein